jgi:hypothetical protein
MFVDEAGASPKDELIKNVRNKLGYFFTWQA